MRPVLGAFFVSIVHHLFGRNTILRLYFSFVQMPLYHNQIHFSLCIRQMLLECFDFVPLQNIPIVCVHNIRLVKVL